MQALLRTSALTLSLCLGVLAGCSSQDDERARVQEDSMLPSAPDGDAVASNNRGVGLMGQFEYAAAREVFADLVARYPDWSDARVNLAIATLNRQQIGDEAGALALVDEVLEQQPEHLRANYVAGLLRLYLSSPEQATPHFRRVAEQDPADAFAAYYLAQCLAQQSAHEEALTWYERAMELDPYLRSAFYGAFQALQKLRRRDEARALIEIYQRLAANPRAHLAEFKYTRMGPKGEALAFDVGVPRVAVSVPEGPVFRDPVALPLPAGLSLADASRGVSLTVADLQGDGPLDLFIAGAGRGEGVHNLLLRGDASGGFRPDLEHPLAGVGKVNAALWGDYDNDGLTDAYLLRRGPNQLWRQTADGTWMDVTTATGTGGGDLDTVDGVFFDADHDGDLDLFLVNADGPNELLNNNLDGTFRPLAVERGIAGRGTGSSAAIVVDIDRDRDMDILVVNRQPPNDVFVNDRLWNYRAGEGFEQFRVAELATGLAADLDADGLPELYTLSANGVPARWRERAGAWTPEAVGGPKDAGDRWSQLMVLDTDGDGVLELLGAGSGGWAVLPTGTSADASLPRADAALAGITPLVQEAGAGPALLGLSQQGGLLLWPPGPGRLPYLNLVLTGKEDQGQAMRSNASGIGAHIGLRVDSRWTMAVALNGGSGPGQSLQPLALGLGGAAKADFLRIEWSDGVLQTELDLEPGRAYSIPETQRQLSSCPVLFVWDGAGYRFVTDFLGVGGMGYAVAPGEYAEPRPWENVLLPQDLAQPEAGRYKLKLSEPMEEAAYIDRVRLVAYDLPPGWQMALDERMGIEGPEPTGEPRFFRRELLPALAVNERGESVTHAIGHRDGIAAPVGRLDPRFIGRLLDEHALVLTFDTPLDAIAGEPVLVADGWVEYPYSQTSFAAWQAGAGFDPPSLEARAGDGPWVMIAERFGYPAGMPRRMALPLRGLPPGASQLRLRSNLEVYWDRLSVAFAEPLQGVQPRLMRLQNARVAKTGFAKRTDSAQRRPQYDYQQRRPFWDARYMRGLYTRLGPAEELVNRADSAYAIIGAGEEIHLEFSAPAVSPRPGWSRRLVLETRGWTKDMDLFTKDGETLQPLPSAGRRSAEAAALLARYNVRFQEGY